MGVGRGENQNADGENRSVATPARRRTVLRKSCWLVLFISIHLSFYVATLSTDHHQLFYPQGVVQANKTLDYTTIVNGARTFLEGGPVYGVPRDYGVIRNPHHPLITLTLGTLLQMWDIPTGFVVYTCLKLVVTAILLALLIHRFHDHPNFLVAAFVFLTFFDQAVEINCGQYWFVLNTFIFLMIYWLQERLSWLVAALWYLGTLVTKPIGLLWIPHLVLVGKGRMVVAALVAYVLLGVGACLFLPGGSYFLVYLFRSVGDYPTNLPRYTLTMVSQYFGADQQLIELLKYGVLLGILLLTGLLRPPLILGLLLWSSYSLLWYPWTYTYHFTCLIPLLTLGLLTSEDFNNAFVKTCAVLLALPSPFFLLKWAGLFSITAAQFEQSDWTRDFDGTFDPTRNLADEGLILLMCWKVFTLVILLTGMVVCLWRKRSAEKVAGRHLP